MNHFFARAMSCGYGGIIATVVATLLTIACSESEVPVPPPPEVNVATLEEASIPLDLAYTARTRGEREVEVRARVSGILEKRFYVEGSTVEAGSLLFRIDPKPLAAAVRSAEGRLGMVNAQLSEAGEQFKRVTELAARGLVAERERDLAEAVYASAKAAVAAATADLDSAKLDLAYTDVRAPISGITGREVRSEGSLVNTEDASSLLTTIAQSSRLYIDFTMPEDEARLVRDALLKQPEAVSVRLRTSGGQELPNKARIEFIDTRVQGDTGTVEVRATLENTDDALSPGQFVHAHIEGLSSDRGIYVPARAVLHSADGPFVWVLDEQDIVQFRPLKLGAGYGNLLQVQEGLAANERIIIDGVLKVQPGAAAKPVNVAADALPAGVAAQP